MAFLMARSGLCLLALAIALGAFGAHGLESIVTEERLVAWKTAVRYQVWLSLVLIGAGFLGSVTGLLAVFSIIFGHIHFFGIIVFIGAVRSPNSWGDHTGRWCLDDRRIGACRSQSEAVVSIEIF